MNFAKPKLQKSDACAFETDETDSRYRKRSAEAQLLDGRLADMAVAEGKAVHALETFEEYNKNNGMFTEMASKVNWIPPYTPTVPIRY